ncbi:hypothetical protein BMW22_41160 (plasmid) [Rhizobium leguminosarum]|uniref:Transposase n=1 Tax=Rhizobium leguminosarum TaxID=384 RepID=A0A1L3ZQ89_RHILE|nr:hypothetical protein BMW22_41160 [Rhizobium leguminosarum]
MWVLRKGFSFTGGWTVNDQNDLLARLFGLQKLNKAQNPLPSGIITTCKYLCDKPIVALKQASGDQRSGMTQR